MQLPATLSDLCKWSPLRRELTVGSFPCCCLRVILAPFVDPVEKVLHFPRLMWLYSQGHSLHPKVLTISYFCKILFLYKVVYFRFRLLGHESLHGSHYCTFHKEGSPVVTPNCPCLTEGGLGCYSFGDFFPLQSWVYLKGQNEGEVERTPELEADKSWLTSNGFLAYQPSHCPFKAICSLLSCIINLISVIALNYVISVNTWRIP